MRRYLGTVQPYHCGWAFHELPDAPVELMTEGWGKVCPNDIGKRYYDVDGVFQIENTEQRDKRMTADPRV